MKLNHLLIFSVRLSINKDLQNLKHKIFQNNKVQYKKVSILYLMMNQ